MSKTSRIINQVIRIQNFNFASTPIKAVHTDSHYGVSKIKMIEPCMQPYPAGVKESGECGKKNSTYKYSASFGSGSPIDQEMKGKDNQPKPVGRVNLNKEKI